MLGPDVIPVPSGLAGSFVCELFYSDRVAFFSNKFSIWLVTILALERWYVVVRPHLYKEIFKLKNVLVFIGSAALVCLLLAIFHNFEKTIGDCKLGSLLDFSESVLKLRMVIQIVMTALFPFLLIFLSYIHINRTIKAQTAVLGERGRSFDSGRQARLLRMVKVSSCALGVCLLPHHIYFLFALFGLLPVRSTFHRAVFVLGMFNSVVNPFIYCATNPMYRQGLKNILPWKKPSVITIGVVSAGSS